METECMQDKLKYGNKLSNKNTTSPYIPKTLKDGYGMKALLVCRANRPRACVAAAFSSRTPVRTLKFRTLLLSVSSSSSEERPPIAPPRLSSPSESANSNAVPSSRLHDCSARCTKRGKYCKIMPDETTLAKRSNSFCARNLH